MGAASGVGEQGYNVGRKAGLLAGLDHHVPGCTVNRFCASSLMTIRMASHAIRAGEGDQYIAAGVEAVSRAGLGAGMMEEAKHPKLNGSEGSLYDVYIPMGLTAENVAERCQVSREAAGRVGGDLPEPRRGGPRLRPFRRRDRPVTVPAHKDTDKEGNEIDVPETVVDKDDGPAPGHHAWRCSRKLKPAFKPDGHRDRRQLLPAERRRGGRAGHVRREGACARPAAEGADHRLNGGGDPPGDHGPGPDPGHPGAAQADRDDDRRHRHRRDQRGVRRADRPLPGGAGDPGGEAQPVRRSDRARPPVRDDRRADHDHPAQRPAGARTGPTGSSRCAWPAGWARRCWSSASRKRGSPGTLAFEACVPGLRGAPPPVRRARRATARTARPDR